jgi:hypothetical protein
MTSTSAMWHDRHRAMAHDRDRRFPFSPLLAGFSLPPASAGGFSGLNFRGFSALERGFSMQALAIFGWLE